MQFSHGEKTFIHPILSESDFHYCNVKHYSLPRDKNYKSISIVSKYFSKFQKFFNDVPKMGKKERIGVKCESVETVSSPFGKDDERCESWRVMEEIRSIDLGQHGYIDSYESTHVKYRFVFTGSALIVFTRHQSRVKASQRPLLRGSAWRGTEEKLMSMKKWGEEETNEPTPLLPSSTIFYSYSFACIDDPGCGFQDASSSDQFWSSTTELFPWCLKIILPDKHFTVSQSLLEITNNSNFPFEAPAYRQSA